MNPPEISVIDRKSAELISTLTREHFWFSKGSDSFNSWSFFDAVSWSEFTRTWDDLLLDEYMRDGGTYRYRRYSQMNLDADDHTLTLLPHSPYEQSELINKLNGGFQRYFEPIEATFLDNPFFRSLMIWMGRCYAEVSGHRIWNIKLHPYRIVATQGAGEPSPEGLHRDGVDYICSLMVRRVNVRGGETVVTDAYEKEIGRLTLEAPGDIVIGDDNVTKHGVSPIEIVNPKKSVAYRDVLVIAFTKC